MTSNRMDNSSEKSEIILDYEEIPSALYNLYERVETLKTVKVMFEGWDSDIAEVKSQSISSLSNLKKNFQGVQASLQALQKQLELSRAKEDVLKSLNHKLQFIANNIPDRFNFQCNKDVLSANTVTVGDQPKSAAPTIKTAPVSAVPEVFFITVDEFEKVPKYMKGRVTYEKINAFIELLNKVLCYKYAIFKKKRSTLKKREADLWNEYSKQELKETKGMYFCVANDFKNFNGCVLDKMSLNILTILRHCGRIRELRTGGILRYVPVF